jgi:5-methylcytosine-specific restriction endonuclease McrA
VEPLAPGRYKVQFTASATLHDKLRRLQALMSSPVAGGDLASIIEEAVSEKLERLEARRFGRTNQPGKNLRDTETAPTSRHVPAAVRRAVLERDGMRCRYVNDAGHRCSARSRLEFHHRHPFGRGGDHAPANISLLCKAHNAYLAGQDYGRAGTSLWRPPG